MMEMGQIFPEHAAVSLPQISNHRVHQSDVQQLQAAFMEDPAELSLETSLAWLREN